MPNPSEAVDVANQAKSGAQSLVDQYKFGDDIDTGTEVDENADTEASVSPPGAAKPVAEDQPLPPRGPDGKFLPKAESPAIPARLQRMAEELGFSEDDLEGASKEQVEEWVYAANKAALKARKSERYTERPEREQSTTPANQDANEFDQVIESGFPPELVDLVRKQSSRIDQLEKMVGQLSSMERGRQVETFASKLDAAIDKMSMPTLFGSGRGTDMDPDSLEFKRRVKIAEEVERDKSKKPLQAKVEAAGMLFGYSKTAKPPISANQRQSAPSSASVAPTNGHSDDEDFEKDWAGAALARPTARIEKEPKGEKKAVATAREYMRNNGMLDDDESGKDGFL